MTMEHQMDYQPNIHPASEANLAVCVEFSAALAKQLLVCFEVLCCLLVSRRTDFVLAF